MPHAQKIAAAALARRVRLLAGPAARGRLVRRLPALPRGLPGRQRLSRASRRRRRRRSRRRRPRRSRSARRYKESAQGGRRRSPGLSRVEQPLGRAGRATRAWWRASCRNSRSSRQSASASRARRRRPLMVAIFKETLTAEAIKAKARALGADLVGIADGAALEQHPPDPDNPQRPSDITDHDGGARHRAGQAPLARRRAHRGVERPAQILQRRAGAHAPRGSLARAGLLARGQRLSGDHRAADARRSVDATRTASRRKHLCDAALAAARGGRGRARHARPQPATAHARIRPARGAHRGALLGRCRVRHARSSRRCASGPSCGALPEGLPGRRGRALEPRLGGVRSAPLAARLSRSSPITSARIIASADAEAAEGAGALGGQLQSLAEHPARRGRHHRLPQMRRRLPGRRRLSGDAERRARRDPAIDAREGSSAPRGWSRTRAPAGCPRPMRRSSAGSAKCGSGRDTMLAAAEIPRRDRAPSRRSASGARSSRRSARRSTPASSTTSTSTGSTTRTSGARSRSSTRTCCARSPTSEFYEKFCVKPDDGIAEFWRSGGATGAPLFYPRSFADIRYAMVGFSRIYQCAGCPPRRTRACVVSARHPPGRADAGALRRPTSASR